MYNPLDKFRGAPPQPLTEHDALKLAIDALRGVPNMGYVVSVLRETYAAHEKVEGMPSQITTPENAPDWAQDSEEVWKSGELAEKRPDIQQLTRKADIQLSKEIDIEPER